MMACPKYLLCEVLVGLWALRTRAFFRGMCPKVQDRISLNNTISTSLVIPFNVSDLAGKTHPGVVAGLTCNSWLSPRVSLMPPSNSTFLPFTHYILHVFPLFSHSLFADLSSYFTEKTDTTKRPSLSPHYT